MTVTLNIDGLQDISHQTAFSYIQYQLSDAINKTVSFILLWQTAITPCFTKFLI
jgi:hypothetical protein